MRYYTQFLYSLSTLFEHHKSHFNKLHSHAISLSKLSPACALLWANFAGVICRWMFGSNKKQKSDKTTVQFPTSPHLQARLVVLLCRHFSCIFVAWNSYACCCSCCDQRHYSTAVFYFTALTTICDSTCLTVAANFMLPCHLLFPLVLLFLFFFFFFFL